MRIGIDIDDTICDTWEYLIPYLSKYFNIDENILRKAQVPYYEACNCTYQEYCEFARKNYDILTPNFKLKKGVKEIIDKLKNEGNEIFFITARSINGFKDPYKISYDYLKKHDIYFDKLIVNAKEKVEKSIEEKIDLFIDDSIINCNLLSKSGVKVLLFDTSYNKNCTNFKRIFNWDDVYEEVKRVKNNG